MTGPAAVTSVSVDGEKKSISIGLRALGRLGIWIEGEVGAESLGVRVKKHEVGSEWWRVEKLGGSVGEEEEKKRVLVEVDVEGFWNALGLKVGEGNEVLVVVSLD